MIILDISFKFEINWATIISLFVGIMLGIILIVLLYCLSAIQSLNKSVKIQRESVDVTQDEIEQEIKYAQEVFEIKEKERKGVSFELIREVSVNLMEKIAKKYYPHSKRPLGELSINEMIMLDRYIMDKLDELLSHKGLRFLKKMKVNSVLKILNIKQSVDKNAVIKAAKKYNISKVTSKIGKVVGILNPANWIKHLAINPSIHLLTKKICTSTIRLIGQETYHIYSKDAFMEPIEDDELTTLLNSIANDPYDNEQISTEND